MSAQLFHRIEGQGESLVLVHPVGLDHTFWGALVEQAAKSYTVISIDLCGHGQSAPAQTGRGIKAYADDIAGLLDQLKIAKTGLLGLSFGGMISQEFALHFPDRTSFLVVGACGARIPPEARDAVRARGNTDPETGMTSVVDTTLQRWFTPPFMGSSEVERVRQRLLANDPAGWAAGWDAIAGFNALDRLGSIKAPALAVAGELDAGTPVPATRAIADAIPGAEFKMLPGAPHMMQIECADRFNEVVMEFLSKSKRSR